MINRLIYETGSGGSIGIYDNDILLDYGMFTDVYLKLFSSVDVFWGNDIFDLNINSLTEKALRNNSLDSRGLENIRRAIESDLKKITYANFVVTLQVTDYDKLQILITANNNQTLQIVWDNTDVLDIQLQDTETGMATVSMQDAKVYIKEQ